MARLAGSPVPVPTTLRSTSGTRALKPGPSTLLLTSTTLTSAPMATLSRVWAVAGATRASAATSMATNGNSMVNLLSRESVVMWWWAGGTPEAGGPARAASPARAPRGWAVGEEHGVAHPNVVTVVRAQEEAFLEHALERGAHPGLSRGIERQVGRAHDGEHRPAQRPVVGQGLIAHAQAAVLGRA